VLISRSLQGRGARTTTWLTWLAALALIAVGVLCLSLSGAVARPGTWWQGTWQALGVGFVVGGIVDVLAISTMNQFASASQRRWNREAARIVKDAAGIVLMMDAEVVGADARLLLRMHGGELDSELRAQLIQIAEDNPSHGLSI
jgi:hypothetical protein